MCDCKRLSVHNFVEKSPDDPNQQRGVAITVTMSAVQSHTPDVTQMRCRTVAVHRRWGGSLWATTTVAVESPKDLFVASHWLERSSSRFSVTLLVFSRTDHVQYFTSTNHLLCGFYPLFIEGLLQKAKALQLIRPPADWSTAVTSHAVFISQNIRIRR